MTRSEFRTYVHPNERSRFILALIVSIPVILALGVLTVMSYGLLLLVVGFLLLLFWLGFETFYARFVGNAIRVSETNYPRLKTILEDMSHQLSVRKKVDVFIYQQGEFNAYFTRFVGRRAIFLNSDLLEKGVSDDEIRWLMGRFLGSVRSQELTHVFGWMIGFVKRLVVFNFFIFPYDRSTACTGDRVALACIGGEISIAIAAMNKLLVGRGVGYSVNPAGIVKQNRNVRGSFFAFLARLFSPVPHTVTRYVELIGFAGRRFPESFERFVAENPSFQAVSFSQSRIGEAS